ncbi:NAD-dependent epimerase/dehydratase family protein [Thiorhodococcus mannitoliphagus]|uniref:NAD-dependent epimerase/dehydratase family protein n=1 Tax=Thiorhodococcus mannitoliphagus TaxID=329406 RepID=A0A6P1DXY7_9GAMM|nr:NAD-dependent epimerase/dehydratase family protein [Thiorhodococcus mannitoliphagus]NEX21586.1 NAD-dependent epimerase/dehydratase family protein [Thiorhodococcus mannitoliphagus]
MLAQSREKLGVVLVTGATGHIGRPLVANLVEAGYRVKVLTRAPDIARGLLPQCVELVTADLSDPSSLRSTFDGVDTLFHLACYQPNPNEPFPLDSRGHWEVTAIGTANLVARISGSHLKRMVYICSARALGKQLSASEHPLDEKVLPMPSDLYGQATLTAERQLLELGPAAGIKTSVLRLPMIYGLDDGDLVRLVGAIATKRFPPWPCIHNEGSAIHVTDAAAAAVLIAESPKSARQIYHVTDGKSYSTRWIYERALDVMGRSRPRWTVPLWVMRSLALAGSITERTIRRRTPLTLAELRLLTRNSRLSSDKICQTLGFIPKHELGPEIERLVGSGLGLSTESTLGAA